MATSRTPGVESCHTQGVTLDEALARLREAVDLYVERLTPEERLDHDPRRSDDDDRRPCHLSVRA
jgi:predicted RNase H-like HicB family nuclease